MLEDRLEANAADCSTKHSGLRVGKVNSSNPDTGTNLINEQHQTHYLTLNKCKV